MGELHILYLGPESGTCLDRANALRRMGHHVHQIDLRRLLPSTAWIDRVIWRLGGQLFGAFISGKLAKVLPGNRFDLCYVDGGELVTPPIIKLLRKYAARVINYSIDDPLGGRDGPRAIAYCLSVSHYDLCVVMRERNIAEARKLGAKDVLRVFMSADELSHAPQALTQSDISKWGSDVLFLGTWFPERGPFLIDLVRHGISISIRGSNWHKAPEWEMLRPFWKGGHVQGRDYAKAIQCAKVNLGMLSKGNRDLHTTRSMEIPALGGLLCAERTTEHDALYEDGREALFWSDAKECALKCHSALANFDFSRRIADAGRVRALANGNYNEKVLTKILDRAMSTSPL